ncbi:hypothetical protein EES43_20275 [Streptomyces sp. ADI96-02]|uniref:hypothetical protein n=1 Tax=Streptomyces sp. ADI96-02 TaxID=1522760 RepID=UPI000F552161|nr:hypothetical protein [Streptomyces sp. ADI96-02]RPK57991.1 hypothetical protein EES43_20275 [Streptomyces sp. ADI96-02]
MNATSTGALLLCRADPETVRPLAHLLRERMLLTRAGEGWSALVPEGKPWRGPDGGAYGTVDANAPGGGTEPVDRILGGWATALAVASTWPVIALWWDADRAGCSLAAGFRRPVAYVWLADGTPAGEDEAMRTLAARLGLDPVLDLQELETLTRPDPDADAAARLRGLLAVLTRTGLILPPGLGPGESADRLRSVAAVQRGAERVEWAGWRDAVRVELDAVENSGLGPWVRGPRARALAAVQLAVGLPLLVRGARRRSGGWAAAGAALLLQGALGLAYHRVRAGVRSEPVRLP